LGFGARGLVVIDSAYPLASGWLWAWAFTDAVVTGDAEDTWPAILADDAPRRRLPVVSDRAGPARPM
jgi:hypothetical protein